jgi:hypothetical protein
VLSVELTLAPPYNPLHRSRIIEMTQTLNEAQKPLDLPLLALRGDLEYPID